MTGSNLWRASKLRPFEVQEISSSTAFLWKSRETPALLYNTHMDICYLNVQSFKSNLLLRVRVYMNICNWKDSCYQGSLEQFGVTFFGVSRSGIAQQSRPAREQYLWGFWVNHVFLVSRLELKQKCTTQLMTEAILSPKVSQKGFS